MTVSEYRFPLEISQRIQRCGVVAVLVIDDAEHAVPLASALLAGGVDCMELTLRTPAAIDALRLVRQDVPQMLAGIGTILFPEQVAAVVAADAAFGVAPGLNPPIVRAAQQHGLPFAPGVVTPSDVEAAIELGCRDLKFFPAEPSGGMLYLRSMNAPYAHLNLRYLPLGGINAQNMIDYLADPAVPAVGGSWLAPRKLIQAQDWATVTANAKAARQAINETREKDTA